jgi:hypothetical protein
MSEPRNGKSAGNGGASVVGDSAASARHKELHKLLGIDTYAEYPRELLEAQMDLPPREPDPKDVKAWQKWREKRDAWKPVYSPKSRIYATIIRYSWCWPICMEYAVVTDDRDEILRDHKSRPLVLTIERIAAMHGTSQQFACKVVQSLVAGKLVRTEQVPGGVKRAMGLFAEPKPSMSEQERKDNRTVVFSGLSRNAITPSEARALASVFNHLSDDSLVNIAADEAIGRRGFQGTVKDYRSDVTRRLEDNHTVYKQGFKTLSYSRRKGAKDIITEARILIDHTQSPPLLGDSGAAAASSAASSPLLLPSSPLKRRGSVRPATHGENGQDVAPVGERPGYGGYGYATDDEALPIAPILEAFRPLRGGITDSHARRLLKDCGGATPAEIADKTGEFIAAVINQRTVKNPAGLVIHKLMEFFHAPASLEMWRRDREEQAAQEAAAAQRAEERRLEVERELQEMPPDDPEAIRQEALERMERKLKGGAS